MSEPSRGSSAAIALGIIAVLIGGAFAGGAAIGGWLNRKPTAAEAAARAQKARELDAWIAKREDDERTRRTSEIIHEEMVRQRVRQGQ